MSEMLQDHSWLAPLFGGVVGFIIGVVVGVRYADMIQTSVQVIIKERESKTFSRSMIAVVVGAWVALAGTVGWLAVQDSNLKANQVELNQQALVTNCMNANESRQAQIDIWDFILGAELADEDNNPAETEMSKTILPFIHEVYKQRDCKDLTKKYPIPPAPKPPLPNPVNR